MNKRILIILVACMFLFSVLPGIYAEIPDKNTENFVEDEILIKFKQGLSNKNINDIASAHGLTINSKSQYSNVHRMRIQKGRDVIEIANRLIRNPNVEYAEPNYIYQICMTPNDPYYSYQWHLHGSDEGGIDMESAWDISTGSGAVVAIVDTGISQGDDLTGTSFVSGYDFVNGDADPTDDNGHGTHCAGTVAQSTNNNIGVCGVAFDASLMPVKVLDSSGSGSVYWIADGIYYAVDNGANIISMSLRSTVGSSIMENAVAYAYNNGVTVIAASGNDYASSVGYPAAYDDYVIAVGATKYDKTRASYSNYGSSLDIVAPGGDLDFDQNGDGYGDGVLQQTFSGSTWGYYFFDGTSMATPHVSGVAALLYSNGVTSPDSIREAIQNSAIDLGSSGWDIYHGHGLLNAYNTLQYNQGDNPPTCSITSPSNGATVSGDVTIQVTATDDIGVTKVDFYVDGGHIGTDTTNPYSWIWDSTTVGDGLHTIMATAYDTASQTTSDSINVIVDNINEPPVANAGPDKNNYVDDVIEFDGSGSYDPDGTITSYEWDFGDGSPVENGEIVTHTYTTVGLYAVTLTVTDNGGFTDSDQAIATIEEAPLETVEFIDSFENDQWDGKWIEDSQNDWFTSTQRKTDGLYSAEVDGSATDATLTLINEIDLSGKSGATITFDWLIERGFDSGEYLALDIYNGVWSEVKRLRGNVDSENTWHYETINLGEEYLMSGFMIRFRAYVSKSNEDANVDNVKIVSYGGQPNNPPTADFSYTTSDLTAYFTDTSTDSGGTIVDWSWNFGDGTGTSTAQDPTYTYAADGTYTVTLTVTDDDGETDSTSQDITVSSGTNNPPTASFTYSDSDLTAFFADTSTDSDGSVVNWNWDFGDGATSTAQNPSHTYSADGIHTVTLTVTDDDGATDTTSQDVTVSSGSSITLTALGYKIKGRHHADLEWSGATSTNVDIYRDGILITTTENDGFYTDNIGNVGGGSYTYQVFEEGSEINGSNTATVTF